MPPRRGCWARTSRWRHYGPWRPKRGLTLTYLKYDALIVACAVRHKAATFVCMDARQKRLAERVKVTAAEPEDYLSPQAALFGL